MGTTRGVRVDTLDELIVALCRDYERRERSILRSDTSHRTKVEMKYLNYKVKEAAMEIVGDDYALYINEIGRSIGYAKSKVQDISEIDYKLKKAKIKSNIAKKMHLSD